MDEKERKEKNGARSGPPKIEARAGGKREEREREIDSSTSWTEYYQFISSIDDDDDESLAVGRLGGSR